jgi:hypothetical protein
MRRSLERLCSLAYQHGLARRTLSALDADALLGTVAALRTIEALSVVAALSADSALGLTRPCWTLLL